MGLLLRGVGVSHSSSMERAGTQCARPHRGGTQHVPSLGWVHSDQRASFLFSWPTSSPARLAATPPPSFCSPWPSSELPTGQTFGPGRQAGQTSWWWPRRAQSCAETEAFMGLGPPCHTSSQSGDPGGPSCPDVGSRENTAPRPGLSPESQASSWTPGFGSRPVSREEERAGLGIRKLRFQASSSSLVLCDLRQTPCPLWF